MAIRTRTSGITTFIAPETVSVSLDAATAAWVAAVIANGGTVSGARQTLVNTLIVGLKADGTWSKLDRLWLLAAENEPSALTDLVVTALAVVVNSPTFTTDLGYTSGAEGTYVDTNFAENAGTNYVLNDAHFSAWNATANPPVVGGMMGAVTGTNLYAPFTGGLSCYARIQDASESGAAGATPSIDGHYIANRSGAAASQCYRNGGILGSPNQSSAGYTLGTSKFNICASGGGLNHTANTQAMGSIGGSLLAGTLAADFYNRLRTYMTAVGVP